MAKQPDQRHATEDSRITALEQTTADHETRIKALEAGGSTQPPPTVPVVDLTAQSVTKPETSAGGTTDFSFAVSRSNLTGASSVKYAVTGSGSAAANASDFDGGVLPSGTVSWAEGQKDKTIVIKVKGDTTVEQNEQFTVTLSAPTGCTIGRGTVSGIISNDDVEVVPPTGTEPNASNTGAKGTLTNRTGSMTLSSAQVIRDKIFNGYLRVTGADVQLINCKVNCNEAWGIDAEGARRFKASHCTVTGNPSNGNSCILTGEDWTVEYCDLSRYDNGIMVQGGTLNCVGNYIHDLGTTPEAHVDGIQIAGATEGGPIDGNSVWSWDTSCVFIKNDWGGITRNIKVNKNWLHNQAGKKTAYTTYTYKTKAQEMSGISFTDNKMERGNWGYLATDQYTPVWTGNTDLITGAPIPLGQMTALDASVEPPALPDLKKRYEDARKSLPKAAR